MRKLAALLLSASFVLSACGPSEMPRQSLVHWGSEGTIFVADNQHGEVRVLYVGASPGSPVPLAVLSAEGREAVLDMRLDPARGLLWVLDAGGVYVHDARTMQLIESVPAPLGVELRQFAADTGHVIAADGTVWRTHGRTLLAAEPLTVQRRGG